MYHVLRVFGEESNGARAVTLNILFYKTHLCEQMCQELKLKSFDEM